MKIGISLVIETFKITGRRFTEKEIKNHIKWSIKNYFASNRFNSSHIKRVTIKNIKR